MDTILAYALIAAGLLLAVWLFLTWYHADDEPMFGPASDKRVTFKAVLHGVFADVVDLLATPIRWARIFWAFVGARLANLPALAVYTLDAYSALSEPIRMMIGQDWRLIAVIFLLNLVVNISPKNAPANLAEARKLAAV